MSARGLSRPSVRAESSKEFRRDVFVLVDGHPFRGPAAGWAHRCIVPDRFITADFRGEAVCGTQTRGRFDGFDLPEIRPHFQHLGQVQSRNSIGACPASTTLSGQRQGNDGLREGKRRSVPGHVAPEIVRNLSGTRRWNVSPAGIAFNLMLGACGSARFAFCGSGTMIGLTDTCRGWLPFL